MREEFIDRMEAELKAWREKLEQLKLKASLGKLELREKGSELMDRLSAAYDKSSDRLRELKKAGQSEFGALKDASEAAWREFLETYRKVSPNKD